MSTWRTWFGELADLVLPTPCPGCGGPDPWCMGCAATLTGRAREPVLADAVLAAFADSKLAVPVIRSLARYRGPARAAIIAGKERLRRDIPPQLGQHLGHALWRLQRIGLVPTECTLVPAPTKAAAARARGGDPVLAISVAAAEVLADRGSNVAVTSCLLTAAGARDSASLNAAQRAANLAGRVRVRTAALPPSGSPIVLIDDVLTTGATIVAACRALAEVNRRVGWVLTVAAVPPWRSVR